MAPAVLPGMGLPLQGITLLAVEDSRFASEALRLMAHRSGARLRRASGLAEARRHLSLYRPDLVLVDLGLADGSGCDLIRDLARAGPGGPAVLAISGDPDGRAAALAAGAACFVEKPIASLAQFQDMVLQQLGGCAAPRMGETVLPPPDPLTLREDLVQAAGLLAQPETLRKGRRRYLVRFLSGLARSAGDPELEAAAGDLTPGGERARAALARLIARRLGEGPTAFARAGPAVRPGAP